MKHQWLIDKLILLGYQVHLQGNNDNDFNYWYAYHNKASDLLHSKRSIDINMEFENPFIGIYEDCRTRKVFNGFAKNEEVLEIILDAVW